jgi:hypothetical protein
LTFAAKGLPWSTELAAGPVDKMKGIEVGFDCNGAEFVFKGALSPKLVNSTGREPTAAEFTAGTGELETGGGLRMKVEGKERILGWEHGEQIQG